MHRVGHGLCLVNDRHGVHVGFRAPKKPGMFTSSSSKWLRSSGVGTADNECRVHRKIYPVFQQRFCCTSYSLYLRLTNIVGQTRRYITTRLKEYSSSWKPLIVWQPMVILQSMSQTVVYLFSYCNTSRDLEGIIWGHLTSGRDRASVGSCEERRRELAEAYYMKSAGEGARVSCLSFTPCALVARQLTFVSGLTTTERNRLIKK